MSLVAIAASRDGVVEPEAEEPEVPAAEEEDDSLWDSPDDDVDEDEDYDEEPDFAGGPLDEDEDDGN